MSQEALALEWIAQAEAVKRAAFDEIRALEARLRVTDALLREYEKALRESPCGRELAGFPKCGTDAEADARLGKCSRCEVLASESPCYICGESVPPSEGWHREDDGRRRHWCKAHRPAWSWSGVSA